MNPYLKFAAGFAHLVQEARTYPLGKFEPAEVPARAEDAPKALFFSPHPDDECISGGIAVRLLREARMNVINVAVTQGSNKERQEARYQELAQACKYIGFGLLPTGPTGLERINPKTRVQDPKHWQECAQVVAKILGEHRPTVVIFPHDRDWNSTHIGTHLLLVDALAQLPGDYEPFVLETEFWGAMDDPNLMVEMSAEDVGDMITALTFHVGEVARNPYHLSLPAWMMDNVRRGGEIVGGQGGAAPDYAFAALYRFRKWTGGKLVRFYEGGKQVPRTTNIGDLFP